MSWLANVVALTRLLACDGIGICLTICCNAVVFQVITCASLRTVELLLCQSKRHGFDQVAMFFIYPHDIYHVITIMLP